MNIKLEIPDEFFQGEERSGYYVSPEMKKVWAVQLDLLSEFSRVCKKYNLKWYADAGTLLGAARHKGFIPWDDDVDVILMRKDYERFCEIAPKEFQAPYRLSHPRNDGEGRMMTCAKLSNEDTTLMEEITVRLNQYGKNNLTYSQGIYIDVFPIDGIPDDDKELMKIHRKLMRSYKRAFFVLKCYENYVPAVTPWLRPIKAVLHYILKFIRPDYRIYFNEFMNTIESLNYPDSKRVAKMVFCSDSKFFERRIWNRSDFNETVYLPFEMLNLPAPSGYVSILDKFYGNWHEFFIRGQHGVFFDAERPYTYYINQGTSK